MFSLTLNKNEEVFMLFMKYVDRCSSLDIILPKPRCKYRSLRDWRTLHRQEQVLRHV